MLCFKLFILLCDFLAEGDLISVYRKDFFKIPDFLSSKRMYLNELYLCF